MEKGLVMFSLSLEEWVKFPQVEMAAGDGLLRQREWLQPRLGGSKFRVYSKKNECPDSGFFLSQQLRHFL